MQRTVRGSAPAICIFEKIIDSAERWSRCRYFGRLPRVIMIYQVRYWNLPVELRGLFNRKTPIPDGISFFEALSGIPRSKITPGGWFIVVPFITVLFAVASIFVYHAFLLAFVSERASLPQKITAGLIGSIIVWISLGRFLLIPIKRMFARYQRFGIFLLPDALLERTSIFSGNLFPYEDIINGTILHSHESHAVQLLLKSGNTYWLRTEQCPELTPQRLRASIPILREGQIAGNSG